MKLITEMGMVYRLSDRAYKKMLTAIAKGTEVPTWQELKAKCLGEIACNTTDIDQEEAQYHLDLLKGE